MRKDSGFTLLEVIVTLLIVGMLATVAGVGIVSNARVYVFARDNTELAQKARFAIQRLTKELRERDMDLYEASFSATSTSIAFNYQDDAATQSRSIALVGDEIKLTNSLTPPAADDPTLVDSVSSFTLGYQKLDGTAWVDGTDPLYDDDPEDGQDGLAFITIDLVLDWHDGQTKSFSTAVAPRHMTAKKNP